MIDSGAIKVSAERSHLVLGQRHELKLWVSSLPALGKVRLTVNIGSITALRELAPGRWQATYHAPKAYYPQVAIIIATARKGDRLAVGTMRVPLWGRGEAEVKTQRGHQVTVRIGDKTFGPARANNKGIANVKVIVPPGVKYGFDGTRKVDLKLPPTRRLHGIVVPERYDGTRSESVTVVLATTDATGAVPNRAATTTPELTGTALDVSEAKLVAPGLWSVKARAPAGKPATIELQALLQGSELGPIRIGLQRVAGAAAAAKLTVSSTVDDDRPVTVQILLSDKLGTPVAATFEPTADLGDFGAVRETGTVGTYKVRWRPPRYTNRERARLSVVAAGRVIGSTTVPLSYPANAWRRRLRPAWFYIAAGLSGALLISGAITRGVALNMSSEYKEPDTTIDRRRELKDSGEPLTDASTALLGVGAAAVLGVAVIYYFTDWGYSRERLAKAGTKGSPTTSFRVGASLQPNAGTLIVGGRF